MARDIEFAVAIILVLSVICTSSYEVGRQISNTRCHDEERDALLIFKEELDVQGCTNPLDSLWDVESRPDCCSWIGITCHNLTGYVILLNITSVRLCDSAKLSPALQELKHLQYLDMGLPLFDESYIPNFLGSMIELRYLRVRLMKGELKNQLRNLTKLEYLNVGFMYHDLSGSSSLEWLEVMPNLKYLHLNNINFSKIGNSWGSVVSNLSSLTELHLNENRFSGHLPLLNLPSIRVLDLSNNHGLSSLNHAWIRNISTGLEVLDLSYIDLPGRIPDELFISVIS